MSEHGTRLAQRQRVRGIGEGVARLDLHALGVPLHRDRMVGCQARALMRSVLSVPLIANQAFAAVKQRQFDRKCPGG